MARSKSLGEKAWQHVAKFGPLVDLSSDFGRALIVPSATAAMASKPRHEAFTPAGRRMRLQFCCIDNNKPPNIFCDHDDDSTTS